MKLTITGEGVKTKEIDLPEPTAPTANPTPRQALTSVAAKLAGKNHGAATQIFPVALTPPEVGVLLLGLNLYDERLKVIETLQGKR